MSNNTEQEPFSFNIITVNIRGLNNDVKRTSFFEWLKLKSVDICFVQESYSTAKIEQVWRNEWGGKIEFSHGTNRSRGCAIFFKSQS